MKVPAALHERIYAMVRRIPHGRVATYGQIAREAGLPGQARLVGYALHNLPDHSRVPWHRVVNAHGGISLDQTFGSGRLQRALLEAENVKFSDNGRIDLTVYGWIRTPTSQRRNKG